MPATSAAKACSKKGTLFSLEDEMFKNATPMGEGVGMRPMDEELLAKLDTLFTESARKR